MNFASLRGGEPALSVVDPYYLAQKAQEYGYHPEIILAGRRMNDSMGEYVASQVVKQMNKKGLLPPTYLRSQIHRLLLLNLLRCEIHREIMISILENEWYELNDNFMKSV